MIRHLTTAQLIDRLYGIGDSTAESHLLECAECADRYRAFEERRMETVETSISTNDLAAQRRAIYVRIDAAGRMQPRWTPAFAAGLLLAVGMVLYRPLIHIAERPAPSARTEMSDEQLFSDVYSMEQSAEPRAAAPIQGLFEPTISEWAEEGQQ
jgi:hypothetical protein